MLRQLALVSEVTSIPTSDLTTVAAALQKQVQRDFAPIWNVEATVSVFISLNDLPVGTWPIIIVDSLPDPRVGGFHTTRRGQPFAVVRLSANWPMTASHEALEMLADPSGNRLTPGDSPMPGQGSVEFVVEVCDPCEAPQFGYQVNGILLSDFYTPHYFDPMPSPGVRYDFTGALTKPLEVARGGYLSWVDPVSDDVFQEQFFGSQPDFVNLSEVGQMQGSLRERIDQLTNKHREAMMKEWANTPQAAEAKKRQEMHTRSRHAQAKLWRGHTEQLMSQYNS
jgi:hypothetical protein